jgi:hypothetical protein
VDRQPSDIADGTNDWVYMGNQYVTADLGQGDIFAESGAQDDIRVVGVGKRENTFFQDVQRKFRHVGILLFADDLIGPLSI